MTLLKDSTKDEVMVLVDSVGALKFHSWYKNTLTYKNSLYTVAIHPDYRDELLPEETLKEMLICEDYDSVTVYEGLEKPFKGEWFKTGDLR